MLESISASKENTMKPFHEDSSMTEIWKDLVSDFLEMACFLSKEEQEHLIRELAREDIREDMIYVHPAFSIGGRLVTVCEQPEARDHWVYFPKSGRIQKRGTL